MTLAFPNPRAFLTSLQFRRSNTPPGTLFMVLEGTADKKAFQPLVADAVHYVPSRGKDMVLYAWEALKNEGAEDTLFVVDCDGSTAPDYLGHDNLIVSTNRDVEADLLANLHALERVAFEYFSDRGENAAQIQASVRGILRRIETLSGFFGAVLDAASQVGAPTKVHNLVTGKRQRLRFIELPEAGSWLEDQAPVPCLDVLGSVSSKLEWGAKAADVEAAVVAAASKLCRLHRLAGCAACMPRRYSNGHDLVESFALVASKDNGYQITPGEFARALRIAAKRDELINWEVGRRISSWLDTRPVA